MSFAQIANQRGLRSVAAHLGELTWDVQADGYQRVQVPADAELALDVLVDRLLPRRGLEPALMSRLLAHFGPLERSLIAWDIAACSLLGPDDAELAARVRAELAPLKQLGGSAAVAISRAQVATLIEAARAESSSTLASTATDALAPEAALALAERFALAHLPSLALAHAQIVWARHSLPAALDRIVEITLDYERFDAMPVLPDQDDRAIERQTYFGMRVALAQLDTTSAGTMLGQMCSKYPTLVSSTDPGLTAARWELELLSDKPVDSSSVSALEQVASFGSTWRYGSRVRDEIRIEVTPSDAASIVHNFVGAFGNDMRVWAQAGNHTEPRAELLALVSREIRYQPHDPEAWRALAPFLDDAAELELELQQRAMEQLVAAFR